MEAADIMDRLPVLAAKIRQAHNDVVDAASTAAERAIEAGHALVEAKHLVGHGKWLPWLKENCGMSERTCQLYMKIAKSGLESATVADLGMQAAAQVDWKSGTILLPTSKSVIRGIGSGSDEWYTPEPIIELVRQALGGHIDLDAASCRAANKIVKAKRFFSKDDDGLIQPWIAETLWCNPPPQQIARFVEKLIREFRRGKVKAAIVLTNNCSDAKWFHALLERCALVCFIRERVRFLSPQGGESESPAQRGALFYFGSDDVRFAEVFRKAGTIVQPYFPVLAGEDRG